MMLRSAMIGIIVGLVAFGLIGCGRVHHRTTAAPGPISYSSVLPREYDVIQPFEESRRQVFLLFWLIPVKEGNGVQIAAEQIRRTGADGAVNLQVNSSTDLLDFFVSLFTVGLVNSWQVEAQGDLVRFREPAAM
ncbi:MAG: hypothetical protein BWZ08_00188 [candidate division BRC1 bacterium ADurb.BinA292]|nr:MAG: hypothetical protein BWZ08_00188 [candidate division BRC1 bacterium ADurb.BinA292]